VHLWEFTEAAANRVTQCASPYAMNDLQAFPAGEEERVDSCLECNERVLNARST
jgi:hypothetical protein